MVGRRQAGDDLAGTGPSGPAADVTVGTILFGMDNGYRMAPGGKVGHMLCHGLRCPVLGVTAEYSVIELTQAPGVGREEPLG